MLRFLVAAGFTIRSEIHSMYTFERAFTRPWHLPLSATPAYQPEDPAFVSSVSYAVSSDFEAVALIAQVVAWTRLESRSRVLSKSRKSLSCMYS